jgi:hypothetical protein
LLQSLLARRPAGRCSAFALLLIAANGFASVADAKTYGQPSKRATGTSVRSGFVKDRALARVLGETLFRDTIDVMSAFPAAKLTPSARPKATDPAVDNSAVGQVARTLLAHRSLDKYLWLIRQAYDDSLWRGGDRSRIERHFSLIWRTSIMLYESSLDASPSRVRICSTDDNGDTFDCHDELERAKVVPIPAQMLSLGTQHEPNIG